MTVNPNALNGLDSHHILILRVALSGGRSHSLGDDRLTQSCGHRLRLRVGHIRLLDSSNRSLSDNRLFVSDHRVLLGDPDWGRRDHGLGSDRGGLGDQIGLLDSSDRGDRGRRLVDHSGGGGLDRGGHYGASGGDSTDQVHGVGCQSRESVGDGLNAPTSGRVVVNHIPDHLVDVLVVVLRDCGQSLTNLGPVALGVLVVLDSQILGIGHLEEHNSERVDVSPPHVHLVSGGLSGGPHFGSKILAVTLAYLLPEVLEVVLHVGDVEGIPVERPDQSALRHVFEHVPVGDLSVEDIILVKEIHRGDLLHHEPKQLGAVELGGFALEPGLDAVLVVVIVIAQVPALTTQAIGDGHFDG